MVLKVDVSTKRVLERPLHFWPEESLDHSHSKQESLIKELFLDDRYPFFSDSLHLLHKVTKSA